MLTLFAVLAQVIPPDATLDAIANAALSAITSGNWWALASIGLIVAVELARKFGGAKLPFLLTKQGGVLVVLLGAFAGALANALLAGAPLTGALALTALKVAVGSVGLRKLVLSILPDDTAAVLADAHKGAVDAGKVAGDAASQSAQAAADALGKV